MRLDTFDMNVNWHSYSLAELRDKAIDSYRQGGGSRPDVLVIDMHGEQAVLKDFNRMAPKFAKWIAPLLVWREVKALRRVAQGGTVKGIPRLLATPDKRAILMQHIPARQVVYVDPAEYDAKTYIANLQRVIQAMHAKGLAHGDLRSPTNSLIDANGDAAIVDFVASLSQGAAWNLPQRYLFNKMKLVDYSAITKLKKRIAPELINPKDIDSQAIAGKKGMAFRRVGQWIRIVSRKVFTSKEP